MLVTVLKKHLNICINEVPTIFTRSMHFVIFQVLLHFTSVCSILLVALIFITLIYG